MTLKSSKPKKAKKPKPLAVGAKLGRTKVMIIRVKPENHAYITKLVKGQGMSLAEYFDTLIEKHRVVG